MSRSGNDEIPENLRQMAEDSVGQARDVCERFIGLTRQSQEQLARSQGEIAASALEVQSTAFFFAEQNIATSFDFAARLARASNLNDYVQLQADFAKSQFEAINQQAQELGVMLAQAAERTVKAGQ
ncbi:MAG TPA: phasin family protein [Hyphomicrobiaceae bacterium]|nr:phasin family protein [Hyphomicrobiaceae bacterium]